MSSAILQSFYDDIVAHAHDCEPWLILADWLEDRSDPRAELVRLTQQLHHDPRHREFKARQARLQALLAGGMLPLGPRRTVEGIEFAWIPPGKFHMGSLVKERRRDRDEKRHRVTLTRGFWMSVYPVTQAQYQAATGTNPSACRPGGADARLVRDVQPAEAANFPVEMVSWEDARQFCWLVSNRTALEVRLPTEAQWEYACRAGTTTPFHFGAILDGTQANCDGTHPYGTKTTGPHPARPTRVGSYPPNAWGLYDLHGNVWEWCQDAYRADYENLFDTDPGYDTPDDARHHLLRGGSWSWYADCCRAANRGRNLPTHVYHNAGFRVCLVT